MKKIFWIFCLCIVASGYTFAQTDNTDQSGDDVYYNDQDYNSQPADAQQQPDQQQDQGGDVSYQQFYDQLSPYGSWVNYPGYGNCWQPGAGQVAADFDPYVTGGHWVYTEYGWTWVSDYDWGWGPFHYGRWFDDPAYGWLWLPGYDWAPAWVVWGDYGGYYCWAPIGPGVVITAHYRPDARYWHFVSHEHIMDGRVDHFVSRPEQVFHGNLNDLNSHVNVISHAGTYKQSVFFAGPKAHEVESYTHSKVERIAVNNTSKPTATKIVNNQVNIYRPSVQRSNNQPAPQNIQKLEPRPGTPQRNNSPATPVQRNNTPVTTPVQPQRQSWTPPRQSVPVKREQPVRQNNYIPSPPAQRYSPPAQHYSPPSQAPHFSPPASGGGGGFRGGGGGRR